MLITLDFFLTLIKVTKVDGCTDVEFWDVDLQDIKLEL
ncbi:hypothetical protein APA_3253 [Pseudanabaena sp. lw0831]|nr:hypothetical protein APA_3253 [Pseudanabaena sp. lw0831]